MIWRSRMAKKKQHMKFGVWAFIIGLAAVLVSSIVYQDGLTPSAVIILGVLGIIVGLLNVVAEEVLMYLVATIAFLVSAQALGTVIGAVVDEGFARVFLQSLIVFIAPGAAIVSLRALFLITED